MLESDSRALFAELFNENLNLLGQNIAEEKELLQRTAEAKSALASVKVEFGKERGYKRFFARLASFFGISTIYSPVLNAQEEVNIVKSQKSSQVLYVASLERNLKYYGSNLPGRHRLLEFGYDTLREQFDLRFLIHEAGRFFEVEGIFDTLRYRVVPHSGLSLRIPLTDSLDPIVYLPKGLGITVQLTQNHHPAGISIWRPIPSFSPLPINPKELNPASV